MEHRTSTHSIALVISASAAITMGCGTDSPTAAADATGAIDGSAEDGSGAASEESLDASGDARDAIGDASDGGLPCVVPVAPASDSTKIAGAWSSARAAIEAELTDGIAAMSAEALYDTQGSTANLLMYADHYQNVGLLEQLADLYSLALPGLVERSSYIYYYAKDANGVEQSVQELPIAKARMWTAPVEASFSVGGEQLLSSSQFAYAVARVIGATAALPPAKRSAKLEKFVASYLEAIAIDHYSRWILGRPGEQGIVQVSGWDCHHGTFTEAEHVKNLRGRVYGTAKLPGAATTAPSLYCNAVTDTDMWIIAGSAELVAANSLAPTLVPLSPTLRSGLVAFVKDGVELLADRTKVTAIVSGSGPTEGRDFDPGMWDDYDENVYTGYTGSTFPGWTDPANKTPAVAPKRASGVGWDLSHARRWVSVFDTLRRRSPWLGTSFPSPGDLTGFGRQFAFVMTQPNGKDVRFTNFTDGTNGWYRVNYDDRPAFGYAPFEIGASAPGCGYGFWGGYEAAARAAVATYVINHPLSDDRERISVLPTLLPFDSEPRDCR